MNATDKIYVVVDASGEYIRNPETGTRTPASNEAYQFDTREEAEAAVDRGTDRVLAWDAE